MSEDVSDRQKQKEIKEGIKGNAYKIYTCVILQKALYISDIYFYLLTVNFDKTLIICYLQ
jgi:hypothetical protein